MSVLSAQTIMLLSNTIVKPLISPFDHGQVSSGSYDLRIGEEYFIGGAKKVVQFDSTHQTITIEANEVALLRSLENVWLPDNIVGNLSLKLDVMLKGLIMSSQSQIDAGYRGPLYILVYNLGTSTRTLRSGEKFARLQLQYLDKPSGLPYSGQYKPEFKLANVVDPNAIQSSLSGLRTSVGFLQEEVEEHRRKSQRELFFTAVGFVIAILSIGMSLVVPFIGKASDASVTSNKNEAEVSQLERKIEDANVRISVLEKQLSDRLLTSLQDGQ